MSVATLVALISLLPTDAHAWMSENQLQDLQAMVQSDWTVQEARRGRVPEDSQAVHDALQRAELLLENLAAMRHAPDLKKQAQRLSLVRRQVDSIESLDQPSRLALYRELRSITRQMALKNPLLGDRPIVFMKRRRFVFQMLHEYLGYYYDFSDLAGGGLYVLENPGYSLDVRDLVGDRLPRGAFATPALSYDARTVHFAFAPVKEVAREGRRVGNWTTLIPPDQVSDALNYFSPQRSCFHIYSVDVDGRGLRQLTDGPEDDFNPCPLPDGGIVFLSTRRGGFCRCGNDIEPVPTYTLHRMDASGENVQTLSFHETNEWHPAVLNDGRIVYSRWDYVDRSAANFHGLWISNPDGTSPRILFGNYTRRINACYQPRAVPGSNRIAFIAGAHHAAVGGALMLVDPNRVDLDPKSGEDRYDALQMLTPEIGFPEAPGWPASYFHSPWPLSEDYYLVAFSSDPLPWWGSRVKEDTETGIYYLDRFGNLELLYREKGVACVGPMPLVPRPKSPMVASALDPSLGEEGEFVVAEARWSLMPLPNDRPAHSLRIFQVLPKTTHVANRPRIGHANAESARMLLGTVPVEADGSAYFRAPAGKPLYFQLVDDRGHAIQSMRSVTYLQPGERRGCVGCHEPPGTAPPRRPLLAMRRGPSSIEPGPEGTLPFSYPRLVQPVLDRHCVRCHDGSEGSQTSPPLLTGEPAGSFTRSYESLKPFVRWHEWGGASITQTVTRPGHIGADESPLMKILNDSLHKTEADLSEEDYLRFCIWLDGNAPFYGTYGSDEQQAQREGRRVAPPQVQ